MGSIRRHFSEGDFTKYLKNKLDDIQNNKAIKLDLLMCDYKDDMKEIKRGYEILEGITYDSLVWGIDRYSDAHIF